MIYIFLKIMCQYGSGLAETPGKLKVKGKGYAASPEKKAAKPASKKKPVGKKVSGTLKMAASKK
ncbi:MAG: hypothetical protein MI892_28405 [Desulfobacterales bacterium]|nr:hypothetical protein [Desulfobacterales bacterium]